MIVDISPETDGILPDLHAHILCMCNSPSDSAPRLLHLDMFENLNAGGYRSLADGQYYLIVEDLLDNRYYELWRSSSAGGRGRSSPKNGPGAAIWFSMRVSGLLASPTGNSSAPASTRDSKSMTSTGSISSSRGLLNYLVALTNKSPGTWASSEITRAANAHANPRRRHSPTTVQQLQRQIYPPPGLPRADR